MKKIVPLIVWSVGVLMASNAAFAQTADEVIEKHLTALGGREALGKITSRTMSGTIALSTPAGEVTVGHCVAEPEIASILRNAWKRAECGVLRSAAVVVKKCAVAFAGIRGHPVKTLRLNYSNTIWPRFFSDCSAASSRRTTRSPASPSFDGEVPLRIQSTK